MTEAALLKATKAKRERERQHTRETPFRSNSDDQVMLPTTPRSNLRKVYPLDGASHDAKRVSYIQWRDIRHSGKANAIAHSSKRSHKVNFLTTEKPHSHHHSNPPEATIMPPGTDVDPPLGLFVIEAPKVVKKKRPPFSPYSNQLM